MLLIEGISGRFSVSVYWDVQNNEDLHESTAKRTAVFSEGGLVGRETGPVVRALVDLL